MLIQAEGVDSLSEEELREDCRERGMLGLLSVEEMRQQVSFVMEMCSSSFMSMNLIIKLILFSCSFGIG